MQAAIETDALIVGAGPVGLTLAMDLAQRGVPVLMVPDLIVNLELDTGEPLTTEQATSPAYWSQQIRSAVQRRLASPLAG